LNLEPLYNYRRGGHSPELAFFSTARRHAGRHVPTQHAQLSLHAHAHGDEVAIADPSRDGLDFSSLV
jgi:hypothetical protein